MTDKIKRSFFSFLQAAVVSILLYGCTTQTLTKYMEKKLDGNYTRMLRGVLKKSWWQNPHKTAAVWPPTTHLGNTPTKQQLYGHLPPITKTVQVRRTRHAEDCWKSKDELISNIILWTPSHGRAKVGRSAKTYIQQLGYSLEDLPEAMDNRDGWRERVWEIRARSATWWWVNSKADYVL